MKKVLLHIAAALSAIGLWMAGMKLLPRIHVDEIPGLDTVWKASLFWSALYLAVFVGYYFAVRALKRCACRGLWTFSLPPLFLTIWIICDSFWFSSAWMFTWVELLKLPFLALLFLPVPLFPVLVSGKKGEKQTTVWTLFALVALTQGLMTLGYYTLSIQYQGGMTP